MTDDGWKVWLGFWYINNKQNKVFVEQQSYIINYMELIASSMENLLKLMQLYVDRVGHHNLNVIVGANKRF